jgi:hypothetical protein
MFMPVNYTANGTRYIAWSKALSKRMFQFGFKHSHLPDWYINRMNEISRIMGIN